MCATTHMVHDRVLIRFKYSLNKFSLPSNREWESNIVCVCVCGLFNPSDDCCHFISSSASMLLLRFIFLQSIIILLFVSLCPCAQARNIYHEPCRTNTAENIAFNVELARKKKKKKTTASTNNIIKFIWDLAESEKCGFSTPKRIHKLVEFKNGLQTIIL